MWQAAVLAAAVLLPAPVLGGSHHHSELSQFVSQFDDKIENELELEDDFEKEVHHHHRHHRHHKHHQHPFLHRRTASLLGHSPEVQNAQDPFKIIEESPAFQNAQATTKMIESPEVQHVEDTPKMVESPVVEAPVVEASEAASLARNPAVTKKLKGMNAEVDSLKTWHRAAAQARSSLEGEVSSGFQHLNEVATIRNQMARTAAQIRAEERKLKQLEGDRLRLDNTHNSLVKSLKHIMGPKIQFAQARLEKKREELRKMQAKAAEWKSKEVRFHESSLAMLEKRDKSKENLEAAAAAEEKAHKEWVMAEKQLKAAKRDTSFDIQGYQYSKTEARAATTKEKREEEETLQAEASVKRLTHILKLEEHRVDESMYNGKSRVDGKLQSVEKAKNKATARLEELKQGYNEWQNMNSQRHNQVVSAQDRTSAAAQEYASARKQVSDSARYQVASDAEHHSDWAWDDWATDTE